MCACMHSCTAGSNPFFETSTSRRPGERAGGGGGLEGDLFSELLEQMLGVPVTTRTSAQTRSRQRNIFQQAQFQFGHQHPRSRADTDRRKRKPNVAAADAIKEVECSLKELYTGCRKTMKLSINIDDFSQYEKEFVINVQQGWKNGTRVRFPESSQFPVPMTFVIVVKPHKYFKVEGNNLVWHCSLSKKQSINGVIIKIPLLNDEVYVLNTKTLDFGRDDKDMDLVVKGKGMPILSAPDRNQQSQLKYGNFIVKFHITSK
jgi:DnaJ-class molecular chaperone